ncbi:hypothetical protein IG631_08815 [Alternaria alternata]|nr:hypothetical protein IG631_08815 [Alternaria alternata]
MYEFPEQGQVRTASQYRLTALSSTVHSSLSWYGADAPRYVRLGSSKGRCVKRWVAQANGRRGWQKLFSTYLRRSDGCRFS